jgi:hypothetical protein
VVGKCVGSEIAARVYPGDFFGASDALQRQANLLRRWNAVFFSDPKGSFGKESFGRVPFSRLPRTSRNIRQVVARSRHVWAYTEFSSHELHPLVPKFVLSIFAPPRLCLPAAGTA